MEFMTITGIEDGKRYIAIYRKWFNENLSAWELNLVPGTFRWLGETLMPGETGLRHEGY
jgi:hypothetical protein